MESNTHRSGLSLEQIASTAAYAKYGEASLAGFQVLPDLLLKNQVNLGLAPTDLVVLLNILMHWWYPGQKPFPRATTIATRMGVSPRTVQRGITHLEALGLLQRVKDGDRTYLDPAPLVEKLAELAKSDTDYHIRRNRRNEDRVLGNTDPF